LEGAADACPYPRPFPEYFDDCKTYQETVFVGLDLQYRPLRPSRTCRFLTVGEIPTQPGTFYGRCALGDAEARQRWVDSLDRERMRMLQGLRVELATLLRPSIEELWRLKGEQLRARKLGAEGDEAAHTRTLRALSEKVGERVAAFLDARSESLQDLRLPREPLIELTRRALDAFVQQDTAEQAALELPGEVVSRLPPDVLTLLRPDPPEARPPGLERIPSSQ
jgi:hypothetical protein